MALSRDPDRGFYVEMEGMVEVRWRREDVVLYKEDLVQFQERVREIPDTFCRTQQAYFYCEVCTCELMSTHTLRDHVKGKKHIKNAFKKKREIMGMESQPLNSPRMKTTKKERPVFNNKEDLETKLRRTGEPAIGLEYITEYVNPRNISDPRQYDCRLEGCKSAWGTSDDIFHHVTGDKHCRNFLIKLNPKDRHIVSMTRADVLKKAAEWEEVNVSEGERDYRVILRVEDYEKYCQLKNRPRDWSQKKESLGLVGNANMAPLGSRKRKVSQRDLGPSNIFDPIQWQDCENFGATDGERNCCV